MTPGIWFREPGKRGHQLRLNGEHGRYWSIGMVHGGGWIALEYWHDTVVNAADFWDGEKAVKAREWCEDRLRTRPWKRRNRS